MKAKNHIIIAWVLTFLLVIGSQNSALSVFAESTFPEAEEAVFEEEYADDVQYAPESDVGETWEENAEEAAVETESSEVEEWSDTAGAEEADTADEDASEENAGEENEAEAERTVTSYVFEDENLYVSVDFDSADALPDDAEVKVEQVIEEDAAFERYSEALREAGSIDAFLLYSVSFSVVDEDGNRVDVEPAEGDRTIRMIFKDRRTETELKAENDTDITIYQLPEDEEVRVVKPDEQEFNLYESRASFRTDSPAVIAVTRNLRENEETEILEENASEGDTESASEGDTESAEVINEYYYEDEKIEVTAVPESPGAIPDTAELRVTEITEESDPEKYAAYQGALAEQELGETLLFYDLSFVGTDENGDETEYEPEEGSVRVTMRFKDSQLTEKLETQEAEQIRLFHLPLVEGADEENLTSDDIIVEPIEAPELSLVEDGTDEASFSLAGFSVIGAGSASGNTQEEPETTGSVTARYIESNMDFVNRFAIFAREASLQNHMEGNIAVQYLTCVQSQFGNSARSVQEARYYAITVNKTVEGAGGKFRFGLFQKNGNDEYTLLSNQTCEIEVPDDGTGTEEFVGSFPNDQPIYIFELDADGNPITQSGEKVQLEDGEYTVTFDSDHAYTKYTTLNDYNTSYVEYFNTNWQSANNNIYNKIDGKPGHIVIGSNNTLGEDQNHHPLINGNMGTSDAATVERVDGAFPIDFYAYLESMKALSRTLATSSSSDSVEVQNITAAPGDEFEREEYVNFNIANDKYLVINIDCTNVTNYSISKITINGKRADAWESDPNLGQNIIFNLYKNVDGQIEPYDGNLTVKEGIGTFLVPAASVTNEATSLGSFIADNLTLRYSEIHKRVPGTTTASGSFDIKNKFEMRKTDLKLRKNDGRTGEVITEDVVIKLEKKDETDNWIPVKDINSEENPTVDSQGEIHYKDLEPGEYRITEVSTKIGYDILEKQITFTIQKDGSITDLSDSGTYAVLETSETSDDPEADKTPVLIINNFKTIVMPETGSSSALRFTLTGLLILLAGLATLTQAICRKERQEKKL